MVHKHHEQFIPECAEYIGRTLKTDSEIYVKE